MIRTYRIFARLVFCLLYPYGRWRVALGDRLWRGRLALDRSLEAADIWMHAASVGEVRVLTNLVRYIKEARPETRIHVTTMTRTGLETAALCMTDLATVSALPIDVTSAVARKLEALRPRLIIVAETEIWPNLIRLAVKRGVGLILVNGRMTERSLKRYLRFKRSLKRLLNDYERFYFKSEADRDRYMRLGVESDRTEVTGDMKFDTPPIQPSQSRMAETRRRLGVAPNDFLVVAGSTRRGEEAQLLQIMIQLRGDYPHLRLVLAPRHLERLGEVEKLLGESDLSSAILGEAQAGTEVVVIDQMGLLDTSYEAADLAFVGGTLVDIGGHNLLEPVWASTPVVYGPSLHNVVEAADYIEEHNYGMRVASTDELQNVIVDCLEGRRQFAIRTQSDLKHSAVATVARQILDRLENA